MAGTSQILAAMMLTEMMETLRGVFDFSFPWPLSLKSCLALTTIKAADRLRTGVDLTSLVGQSDDKDIDCILFNRMSDSTPVKGDL